MEETTILLLEEIDKGCLMALNSFDQIEDYEMREGLEKILQEYKKKHEEIQKETSKLLEQYGRKDKRPHPLAEAMSWITTEMKLLRRDSGTQIAKLMMDGCNMGIQGIGEKINKFPDADKEATALGKKLIRMEQQFMDELKAFL